MKIIKLTDEEWDFCLTAAHYKCFFYTSFWKNQIIKNFGGQALLIKCEVASKNWLVPLYFGKPWSQGFRTSSIGYGGPIPLFHIHDPDLELKNIRNVLTELESKYKISCKGFTTYPSHDWASVTLKNKEFLSFTQILSLEKDPTYLFEKVFSGNVRTSIRRAQKEGVCVRLIYPNEVKVAYKLLVETQQTVKSTYVTPFSFFSSLFESASNGVKVWGAFSQLNEMVAMSMSLFTELDGFHLFSGWDRRLGKGGANQAILWTMIQEALKLNLVSFNLGESPSELLNKAKSRWGGNMVPILKGDL